MESINTTRKMTGKILRIIPSNFNKNKRTITEIKRVATRNFFQIL